jgi:hypothetical protein
MVLQSSSGKRRMIGIKDYGIRERAGKRTGDTVPCFLRNMEACTAWTKILIIL